MRVVLVRHAKPYSEGFAEDALRPLSDEGREVQYKMTKLLKEKGIRPTAVLTSPLLRARDTAQFFTDFFDVVFEEEPALGNEFNNQVLLKRISEQEEDSCLVLVGHAPTLEEFLHDLTGGEIKCLSKSSAAIVDFEGEAAFGKGVFVAYYDPKQL